MLGSDSPVYLEENQNLLLHNKYENIKLPPGISSGHEMGAGEEVDSWLVDWLLGIQC